MADLAALTAAVEAGHRATAAMALTTEAIDEGLSPQAILDAMTAAMDVIGGRFQRGEIYVPEMLISARAMKEATAILEPLLVGAGIRPEIRAVMGTIQGDLHDIGKNLVAMMWRGANIEVVDLGTNVSPEQFVAAVREHDARLVGISALLTTTMVEHARRGDGDPGSRPGRREGHHRRRAGDGRVRKRDRRRRLRAGRRLGRRGREDGSTGFVGGDWKHALANRRMSGV